MYFFYRREKIKGEMIIGNKTSIIRRHVPHQEKNDIVALSIT
jgi:hypothetical protein